jgi:hypothetical protein
MDGTDTYQLTIDAAGGTGSVRNGVAEGTDVTEQTVFAAKSAARDGDKMTVTFERPLKGDATMRDIVFGTPLFLYASARNASAALTSSHPSTARYWSPKAIELLCDKADPCEAGGTAAPTTAARARRRRCPVRQRRPTAPIRARAARAFSSTTCRWRSPTPTW